MARVLVIDDDETFRVGLARLLTRAGHEVAVEADGRGGVRALAKFDADVVLTDINMAEMDGIEVITALRAERPDLPVIAISGGGRMDKAVLLDSAVALGATTGFEKPLDIPQVLAAIEDALGQSGH